MEPLEERYCFLSHNWGDDETDRDNHARVQRVRKELDHLGVDAWLDDERLRGDIHQTLADAIDGAAAIVVFVTSTYIDKVAGLGPKGNDDYCKYEFEYSILRRSVDRMIAVVMEPQCLNHGSWHGAVGAKLGGRLHVDLTSDAADDFQRGVSKLAATLVDLGLNVPATERPHPARTAHAPRVAIEAGGGALASGEAAGQRLAAGDPTERTGDEMGDGMGDSVSGIGDSVFAIFCGGRDDAEIHSERVLLENIPIVSRAAQLYKPSVHELAAWAHGKGRYVRQLHLSGSVLVDDMQRHVPVEPLAALLASLSIGAGGRLEGVLLSVGESDRLGELLVRGGVPHAVFWRTPLQPAAALEFTRGFYLAYHRGCTIDECFQWGCTVMQLQGFTLNHPLAEGGGGVPALLSKAQLSRAGAAAAPAPSEQRDTAGRARVGGASQSIGDLSSSSSSSSEDDELSSATRMLVTLYIADGDVRAFRERQPEFVSELISRLQLELDDVLVVSSGDGLSIRATTCRSGCRLQAKLVSDESGIAGRQRHVYEVASAEDCDGLAEALGSASGQGEDSSNAIDGGSTAKPAAKIRTSLKLRWLRRPLFGRKLRAADDAPVEFVRDGSVLLGLRMPAPAALVLLELARLNDGALRDKLGVCCVVLPDLAPAPCCAEHLGFGLARERAARVDALLCAAEQHSLSGLAPAPVALDALLGGCSGDGGGGGGQREQLAAWIAEMHLDPSFLTDVSLPLRGCGIGNHDMSAVALLIKFNATLTELNLAGKKLTNAAAPALAEMLKVNATLTTLNLWSNKIGDAGAIGLGKALEVNATLTDLDLYKNKIGDAGAIGLGKALEVNATLTDVNLLSNKFGITAAAELVQAAKSKGTQLKSLCGIKAGATSANFAGNGLGDSDAILLAYDLEVNATLTTLNLLHNEFSIEAAAGLLQAATSNKGGQLKSLVGIKQGATSFSDKIIGDAGAILLSYDLKVNATLTELSLWGNQIGDAGAMGLGKALEVNATLTTLWLNGNKVGDSGAIGLGKALEVNATLTTLILSGNQIGASGAIGLGQGLSVNATLTTLWLNSNKIGDSGAIGLGKALEFNATLTALYLNVNQIGDAGAIGLDKALKVNATLTKLDLEYNNLGDTSKKTVRTAWLSKTGRPKSGLEI
jgi:Ran GTPase-activating protein (RanGAP) involved in mRNA processing and transport